MRSETYYVECNLCGSDDYKVLFPENVAQVAQIVECNRCGLMYVNPRGQTDGDIRLEKEIDKKLPDERNPQYFRKQQVQIRDYRKILDPLKKLGYEKGKVLEIGAYAGTFLNLLKREGWDVLGVDPMKSCSIYAWERYKIKIIPSTLIRAQLDREQFDIVIMLHVIEHVDDPMAELEEVYSILKPGGIVVIETPRYDSLMFKLLGRRERSIACQGHIFFFTIKTIRALIERCGFEVRQLDLVGRTLTVERLLHNLGVIAKNKSIQSILKRLGRVLHLDQLIIHLNMRDMLRIYCRKSG